MLQLVRWTFTASLDSWLLLARAVRRKGRGGGTRHTHIYGQSTASTSLEGRKLTAGRPAGKAHHANAAASSLVSAPSLPQIGGCNLYGAAPAESLAV